MDIISASAVNPLSKEKIERLAKSFLMEHHPKHLLKPSPLNMDQVLCNTLAKIGFEVDLVDDLDPNIEALTVPLINKVKVSEKVYNKLCDGDRRAKFTIGHETGHVVLHAWQFQKMNSEDLFQKISLAKMKKLKPYEDPEWQANQFSAAILMPQLTLIPLISELTRNNFEKEDIIQEIMNIYGVSKSAASIRLSNV